MGTISKIKLGDTTYDIKDTNYYHTPSSTSGIKIGTGTGVDDMYVPTGTTSTTVATGNHTHSQYLTAHQTVSLASGTNNGTLKITVNGSTTDNIAVKGLGSAAYTASTAYAAASHSHSYAGSSSAGGAATSANKVKAAITFNNGGSGVASGTTFDGSTARTISYNTIGAAASGHTHTITIASSTDTSSITLSHGSKYSITAGGSSFVFTMPSDSNTHNTAYLYVGTSSGTGNASTSNGNTYLILNDGGTYSRRKIYGSGSATVTSDSSGNICISSSVSVTVTDLR